MTSQTATPLDAANSPISRPDELARMGLTGVMGASWIGALTYLTQLPFAHWQAPLLVPVAIITFLSGFYFAKRRSDFESAWKTWLIGLILPAILHRILAEGLSVGLDGLVPTLIVWIAEPSQIANPSFFFNTILLMATWIWSVFTSADLRGLGVQTGEILEESQAARFFQGPDVLRSSERLMHSDRLRHRWIQGVAVLVVVVALLHFFNSPMGQDVLISDVEIGVPIFEPLAYVVAGLVLLSLNQLVRMSANWEVERSHFPPGMMRRWLGNSLVVVGGVLALALILPTGYGQIVLEMLKLLEPVLLFIIQIGLLIGVLVIALISLPFRLFPGAEGDSPAGSSEFVMMPQVQDEVADYTLIDTLKALAGWVLVAVAIYFVTRYLWQRRRQLRIGEIASDIAGLFWLSIASLMMLLRGIKDFGNEAARYTINRILGRDISVPANWRPAIRLRNLNERGWLEYMVLSIFSRAQKLGHGRPADMTAAEYAARLREDLPLVEPRLSRLVDRFHQARYGQVPISSAQVDEAKDWWSQLKRLLQQTYRAGRRDRD